MAKITKCEHKFVSYDKINDYNYCQDCNKVFQEEDWLLDNEKKTITEYNDEVERNLERLNNL